MYLTDSYDTYPGVRRTYDTACWLIGHDKVKQMNSFDLLLELLISLPLQRAYKNLAAFLIIIESLLVIDPG